MVSPKEEAARVDRTAKAVRYVQDMPPKGGFPHINFHRQLPAKNVSTTAIFLGSVGIMCAGLYVSAQAQVARRQVRREQYDKRWQIIALLQAEADRRWIIRRNELYLDEYETMKNVPGWKVDESPYNTKRFVQHAAPVAHFRERDA